MSIWQHLAKCKNEFRSIWQQLFKVFFFSILCEFAPGVTHQKLIIYIRHPAPKIWRLYRLFSPASTFSLILKGFNTGQVQIHLATSSKIFRNWVHGPSGYLRLKLWKVECSVWKNFKLFTSAHKNYRQSTLDNKRLVLASRVLLKVYLRELKHIV